MNISNIRIVKRTFEGLTDPTKNDNPVTSKYYTSKKYIVLYDVENCGNNPMTHCTQSKKEAHEYVRQMQKNYNL